MADTTAFERVIKQDRASRQSKQWHGTLLEYLEILKADPMFTKLSHARVYDLILSSGMHDIQESDDPRTKRLYKDEPVKVYHFFADEFFGIERTIAQLVRYFQSASLKGEESRQVLYLMGPVGSGKSSLVERIQRGLEQASSVYALAGCPMHEEPLHLIPSHLRREFEKMLGVHIEGDLCPVCRSRLKQEFGHRYEEFPIEMCNFSKRNRIGIGVVPPVDPNNQDTSVLIGSEDISKLDQYSEGDPRVLDLSGALNIGNRGLVEFIEVFKNETEYLQPMITATQEKLIPAPGRHGMIYIDTCILAHSNEAEWRKFRADDTNEAILDRMVVVKVSYNLRLSEEIKIYQKIIRNSDFRAHTAPHTLELASMFAILSRLEATSKCDLMTKLRLYNGEDVIEKGRPTQVDVEGLKEDAQHEGMSGISTRFIMKGLDNALADNIAASCIDPIHVREALISMTKEAFLPAEKRKRYLEFLRTILKNWYLDVLEKELRHLFVSSFNGQQAEELFRNYLHHVEVYVTKDQARARINNHARPPDERFLASIEEHIAITSSMAKEFRQQILDDSRSSFQGGANLSYNSSFYGYASLQLLKEAIDRALASPSHMLEVITNIGDTISPNGAAGCRGEAADLAKTLLEDGYCENCIGLILKYATANLWKDGRVIDRAGTSPSSLKAISSATGVQTSKAKPHRRKQPVGKRRSIAKRSEKPRT